MNDSNVSVMYNASGNYDPTAGCALGSILKFHRNKFVKRNGLPVYICMSRPIKSQEDFYFIDRCCRFAVEHGALPLAPLLFYADLYDLSEPQMQYRLLKWTSSWIKNAAEIWVFGNKPLDPIKPEFDKFVSGGKVIRYFGETDNGDFAQNWEIRKSGSLTDGGSEVCRYVARTETSEK